MATKNTTPASMTGEQYRLVLQTIAGHTETLHQLTMIANGPYDEFIRDVCASAAVALAAGIGAMADGASGAGVIGDANRWFYGPNFKDDEEA